MTGFLRPSPPAPVMASTSAPTPVRPLGFLNIDAPTDRWTFNDEERKLAGEREYWAQRPEGKQLGPDAKFQDTASGFMGSLGVEEDSDVTEELVRFEKKLYQGVNKMMPKWFTKFDNKVRDVHQKLMKPQQKVVNTLKKPANKLKKKLRKLF